MGRCQAGSTCWDGLSTPRVRTRPVLGRLGGDPSSPAVLLLDTRGQPRALAHEALALTSL